jgi:Melibiase
LRRWAWNSVSG